MLEDHTMRQFYNMLMINCIYKKRTIGSIDKAELLNDKMGLHYQTFVRESLDSSSCQFFFLE